MMFSNTFTPPFRCRIGYDNKAILSHSPWLCHKLLIHISHFVFVSHFRVPDFRIKNFNDSSLRNPAVCSCLFRRSFPQKGPFLTFHRFFPCFPKHIRSAVQGFQVGRCASPFRQIKMRRIFCTLACTSAILLLVTSTVFTGITGVSVKLPA